MINLKVLKQFLCVDDNKDDLLIKSLLDAAINKAESIAGIILRRRSVTQHYSEFSSFMPLRGPVVSVESVSYTDQHNEVQELLEDSVFEAVQGLSGGVRLSFESQWPQALGFKDCIAVTYTAGYESDEIPGDLRIALMMLVSHFYDNRETLAPVQLYETAMSFKYLLQPYVQVGL